MTRITYDIVSRRGGWCIACAGVVGPPYFRKREAIEDAQFIANALREAGDEVIILVEGAPDRQPTLN